MLKLLIVGLRPYHLSWRLLSLQLGLFYLAREVRNSFIFQTDSWLKTLKICTFCCYVRCATVIVYWECLCNGLNLELFYLQAVYT